MGLEVLNLADLKILDPRLPSSAAKSASRCTTVDDIKPALP